MYTPPPTTNRIYKNPALRGFKPKALPSIPDGKEITFQRVLDPKDQKKIDSAVRANLEGNPSLGKPRPGRQASNMAKASQATSGTPLSTLSEAEE